MGKIKGKPVTNLTKGCFQHLLKLFSHHLQDKSSTWFASLFITSDLLDGKSLLFFTCSFSSFLPSSWHLASWHPPLLPSSCAAILTNSEMLLPTLPLLFDATAFPCDWTAEWIFSLTLSTLKITASLHLLHPFHIHPTNLWSSANNLFPQYTRHGITSMLCPVLW